MQKVFNTAFSEKMRGHSAMPLVCAMGGTSIALNLIEVYANKYIQGENWTYVAFILAGILGMFWFCSEQIVRSSTSRRVAKKDPPSPKLSYASEPAARKKRDGNLGNNDKSNHYIPREDSHEQRVRTALVKAGASNAREEVVKQAAWLSSCANRGDLALAEEHFKMLEAKGIPKEGGTFFFSTMLRCCAQTADHSKAEQYMQKLVDSRIKPDAACFAAILETCRSSEDGQSGIWRQKALDAGISDEALRAEAVQICVKTGKLQEAEQLLEAWVRTASTLPTAQVYQEIIEAYSRKSESGKALHWMERLLSTGAKTDASTYSAVISASAQSGDVASASHWLHAMEAAGHEPQIFHYNAMITACSKRADLKAAEAIFKRIEEKRMPLAKLSFANLIFCATMAGDLKKAEQWVKRMQEAKQTPGQAVYGALVQASARANKLPKVEQWLFAMIEEGFTPDAAAFNHVIDACARCGELQRAKNWLGRMRSAGIKPTSQTYSGLISAHSQSGSCEAAMKLLETMQDEGIAPDTSNYNALLIAHGKAKDIDGMWRIYAQMEVQKISANGATFTALAKPFAASGNFVEVEKVLELARPAVGNPMEDSFLLTSLLNAYGNARPRQVEKAERAFRLAKGAGVSVTKPIIETLERAVGADRAKSLVSLARSVNPPPQDASTQSTGNAKFRNYSAAWPKKSRA